MWVTNNSTNLQPCTVKIFTTVFTWITCMCGFQGQICTTLQFLLYGFLKLSQKQPNTILHFGTFAERVVKERCVVAIM